MKFIIIGSILAALALLGFWLWTPDKPRAVLEARYLRSPADMIDVAGQRLRVRDDGPKTAPAVLMLHGFGSSLETWEGWAKGLVGEFRVIRFDLPGSGLSPPDVTGVYTDARTIDLILALLDQLGIEKTSIIGNSIGGRIAWTFAALHPERLNKLILVSPDGFASPGFAYGVAPKVPAMLGLMRYVLPRPFLKMNLVPVYADPSLLTETTVTRYWELMLAPGARDAMIARMSQTVLVDPEPLLRSIQAPVLLIWGEKDAAIPFTNSADYMRLLPHARLVPFPNLGHVPQEEAPEASLVPVRAFLEA